MASVLRHLAPACALALSLAAQANPSASEAELGLDLVGPPGPVQQPTAAPRPESERRPIFAGDALPALNAALSPDEPSPRGQTGDLLAMGLPLAGVIGLILLSAAVLRRVAKSGGGLAAALTAGGAAPAGIIEVLARYPISRGQSLVLLKVDRRVLLLSHASGVRGQAAAFSTLSEITDPDEVASILLKARDGDADTVDSRFRQSMERYAQGEDEQATVALGRRVHQTRDGDLTALWDEHAPPTAIAPAGDDAGAALRARLTALRGRADYSNGRAA